jgi:hypothetical protein
MTTKNMSFDLQNGGLRLIQTGNINTSFDAVYQMITNPLSTLTKISYSSLKGFIFKLDVPHDVQHTYFYGLNDSGTSYNVPVYTLILKFAIITDRTESLPNFIYMHDSHNKSTENLIEYATESKTQQDIYVATVSPSGNPICPAVADFSYFDCTSGEILLAKLIKNTNNSATIGMVGDNITGSITTTLGGGNTISLDLQSPGGSATVTAGGSTNTVTVQQTGGGSGHQATVELLGSGNTVGIQQQGTLGDNIANIKSAGSGNTFSINQNNR